MTTEKNIMLFKNIMNKRVGEEEKMFINKIKNGFEKDENIPKNMKICLSNCFNYLLNGDEKIEETFMNIQFNENDINFLKEVYKKIQEIKIFPSIFDKIDDDFYNFLLDMKNETLKKRLEEKFRDVQFY